MEYFIQTSSLVAASWQKTLSTRAQSAGQAALQSAEPLRSSRVAGVLDRCNHPGCEEQPVLWFQSSGASGRGSAAIDQSAELSHKGKNCR